jgi:anti-anti-sigma factor
MIRTIRIEQDLDAAAMVSLRAQFEEFARGDDDIELDLSRVAFIDSSGVGGLVFLYKRLAAEGRRLTVIGLTGQPRQLLDHLSVARILAGRKETSP